MAAQQANLSQRRVARLCEQGRIPGAQRIGRAWAIPEGFKVTPRGPGRPIGQVRDVGGSLNSDVERKHTAMAKDFVQFDKSGPFFEMVGAFLVAISSCPAIFNTGNPMKLHRSHYISMTGVHVDSKHLYPFEVYEQARSGHITLPRFVGRCCMMLANTAYESVKEFNDHSPEFEFFRHVRNASSHQNLFTFSAGEPSRPASWRGAVLDHTKRGAANPLQGTHCLGPVLGPADLIDLLKDIELKLAAQTGARPDPQARSFFTPASVVAGRST